MYCHKRCSHSVFRVLVTFLQLVTCKNFFVLSCKLNCCFIISELSYSEISSQVYFKENHNTLRISKVH